ncbi:MAG: TonB-dependent receptor plug, partial [bacterium]
GGSGSTIPAASDADKAFAFFDLPAGFLDIGPATNLPQGRLNDNYQFLDNFSINVGRHTFKAGLDLKRRLTDSNFLPNQNGSFRFTSLPAFFNNMPTTVSIGLGKNVLNFTEFDQAYYFEDSFKIKDNFTLSLGVRYENTGQPINILNEITTKRESDPTTALFNTNVPLVDRTFPGVDTDNNNFAPRIGFAYTPRLGFAKKIFGEGKTVIRGGYGLSYDLAFYNILLNSATAAPVVFAATITTNTAGLVPVDPTGPGVRAAIASRIPTGSADPRTISQTGIANDFHNPYTQQYSLGIQRQFGNNTIVEARYVGTHGVGLFQSVNANPSIGAVFNDFGSNFLPAGVRPSPNGRLVGNRGLIRNRINGASSSYNALQTRFDTRIKNLIVGASYTYSKQIDNASEIFGTFGGGGTSAFAQNPFDTGNGERALGAYDFRHVFSTNFIYGLPIPSALRGNKIAEKVLGGYEISGTFRTNSAQRYTPTQAFFGSPYTDAAFAGFNGGVEFLRPFAGNPNAPVSSVAIDNDTAINVFGFTNTPSPTGFYLLNSFNNSPNSAPVPVTLDQVRFIANTEFTAKLFGNPYGNVSRNAVKGDETFLANFAIFKNTKIRERMNLQFRAEFFNVFNHPNLGTPDVFVDDAGIGFGDLNFNDADRRTIQYGLKLTF